MPLRLLAAPAQRSAGVLLVLGSLLSTTTLLTTTSAVPASASPAAPEVTTSQAAATRATASTPSIERLASTVGATSCEVSKRPGVTSLGKALSKKYAHTGYRVTVTCDSPAVAEQRQGRVLTWKVSTRKSAQVKQARSMLDRLLATDAAGDRFADARRLGVTRVVWKDREWRAASANAGWTPYGSCATDRSAKRDERCGRSGMQVVLGWSGAMKRTSYWKGRVAAEDYGPCRPADLSWASRYGRARTSPCPGHPALKAPAGSTKADRALVSWSGVRLAKGSKGAAVKVVQRAVGVKATGTFDTRTRSAVQTWQRRHHLARSGVVDSGTWRALLRSTLSVPMTTSSTTTVLPTSTMPLSSPSGWRRTFSQDFVTPAPIGSFVNESQDDWYLKSSHPYARSLRSYPDGWGTTGNMSTNYASKTVAVSRASYGALGVFQINAHTDTVADGSRRSLAASIFAVTDPNASGQAQVAQTYGRYSVRFRTVGGYPTSGSGPRYGSAFLLWPADDVWDNGEIDYPEMAWGGKVGGFVHTIGNPVANAAVIDSSTSTEGAWHVATIEWRPTALVFSLDGRVLQTVTHDVPNKPFRWGFQSGGHDGTPADGVKGQLLVDWITIDAYTGPR